MLRSGNLRRPETALLVCALVVSFSLRLVGVFGKETLTYDESISCLSATGHQGELGRANDAFRSPVGVWVAASEWKRFLQPEEVFVFGRIADDLAHYDVHPPLYFWLLHLWSLLVGVHVWSGPLLNALLSVMTTVAVFYFARYVLETFDGACAATAIWALSPAVILSTWFARMYELVAPVSLIFVWLVSFVSDTVERCRARNLALITALSLGCLLTHYLLLFVVIIPATVFVTLRLIRKDRKRLAVLLVALSVGVCLISVTHPSFYLSFLGQQEQVRMRHEVLTLSSVDARLDHIVHAIVRFFLPDRFMILPRGIRYFILLLPYTLLVWLIAVNRRAFYFPQRPVAPGQQGIGRGHVVVYFFVTIVGSASFLYLSFVLNTNQFAEYKMAMMWPFMAIGLVLLGQLPSLVHHKTVLAFVTAGLLAVSASVQTADFVAADKVHPDLRAALIAAKNVVIDTRWRGVVLPIVQFLPDATPVFIAMQPELLHLKDEWVPAIQSGTVFVHYDDFGASRDYTQEILEASYSHLIASGYRISQIPGRLSGTTA